LGREKVKGEECGPNWGGGEEIACEDMSKRVRNPGEANTKEKKGKKKKKKKRKKRQRKRKVRGGGP